MNQLLKEYLEEKRQEEIEKSGINGYCACCGAPVLRTGTQHDETCVWYDDQI